MTIMAAVLPYYGGGPAYYGGGGYYGSPYGYGGANGASPYR